MTTVSDEIRLVGGGCSASDPNWQARQMAVQGARRRRPRRRVIKPAETRRAELLAAATRLFEERGFEEVTVADITEAAGVAKGTFYLYFDSKEALLDALRHDLTDSAASLLDDLGLPDDDGWAEFTDRLVRRAIAFQVEQYELHELIRLPHRHALDGGALEPADRLAAGLQRVIEAGVAAGEYRVDDPEMASRLVYDFLHAAGDRACALPERRASIATTASQLVRQALLRA
jgi:AcrR family transcriptional regulator